MLGKCTRAILVKHNLFNPDNEVTEKRRFPIHILVVNANIHLYLYMLVTFVFTLGQGSGRRRSYGDGAK